MKYILAISLLVFLASCGAKTEDMKTNTGSADTEIQNEVENIEVNTEANNESKIITSVYENPKGEVNMDIKYSLDEKGMIKSLEVSSNDYDLAEFSKAVNKEAVGKTLEEASNIYISGSSLTTEAFNKALKENM